MGLGLGRLAATQSWDDLRSRLISAVVLGLLVLGVAVLGGVAFRILCFVAGVIVFDEWTRMTRAKQAGGIFTFTRRALFASYIAFLFDWPVLSIAILVAAGIFIAVVDRRERRASWLLGGLCYAGLAGLAPGMLRGDDPEGLAALGLVICVVWATDVFAYFFGRTIGGRKLLPRVSPKKTLSGAVGGLLAGVGFGLLYSHVVAGEASLWIAFLSAVLSILGQTGDLFESWVKRRFGVKDSGRLIPGHGGLMDRIDALVVSTAALWLIALILRGVDEPARAIFAL
ncbi:phosphatidate cytidylyltransferase [Aureimonas mangrovi]|uniref:phosphatidate cytidylyltransferase n=1 Tax=Aureimonas mangrovi TaxID=2758041 RepID=UPI00163DDAA6|nr:phosphatidate cytidylyltransferase [Aureimonas mangrovi]